MTTTTPPARSPNVCSHANNTGATLGRMNSPGMRRRTGMPLCLPSSMGTGASSGGTSFTGGNRSTARDPSCLNPCPGSGSRKEQLFVCPRQTETAAVDRHPDRHTDRPTRLRLPPQETSLSSASHVTFSRIWLGGLLLCSRAVGYISFGSHDTGRLATRCQAKSIIITPGGE